MRWHKQNLLGEKERLDLKKAKILDRFFSLDNSVRKKKETIVK